MYWDANAFIGLLKREPQLVQGCQSVIQAAEEGKVLIATSALTIAEVIRGKGLPPMTASKRAVIDNLLHNPWIDIYDLDRELASRARDIIWSLDGRGRNKGGLSSTDAIHVVTALEAKASALHTNDAGIARFSGLSEIGTLKVSRPMWAEQPLPFARPPSVVTKVVTEPPTA